LWSIGFLLRARFSTAVVTLEHRIPKEFLEIHEKHYDDLLAKIIQLAER
jgi:hypothetical protein